MITWLLSKVAGWLLPAGAIVGAVLLLALGVQTHRVKIAKAETQEVQNAWTLDAANRTKAALTMQAEFQAERDQTNADRKKADDENAAQLARARADAVIADAASGRLRDRYAALVAASRAAAADPSAVASGAAAQAADLPADMFSRVLEIAGQYRDAAEAAITAGERAEAEYNALTPISLGKLKLGL